MTDFILTALKFVWYRNSTWASCVAIVLSSWMSDRDLRDLAQYYEALLENRKQGNR